MRKSTLRRALRAEGLDDEEIEAAFYLAGVCDECNGVHTPERRQRILARYDHTTTTAQEIREAWPCMWPCDRMLFRDLKAIGVRLDPKRPRTAWWQLGSRFRGAGARRRRSA